MRKVKEYLDKFFYPAVNKNWAGEISVKEKDNGHLGVFGCWFYPEMVEDPNRPRLKDDATIDEMNEWHIKELQYYSDHPMEYMFCPINNETIQVNVISDDPELKMWYGYLMTYEHIPRGEPDEHGYYARSTDEEVIAYIDKFYQILKKKREDGKINEMGMALYKNNNKNNNN